MTSDLDYIDNAIEEWELSGDAFSWSATGKELPYGDYYNTPESEMTEQCWRNLREGASISTSFETFDQVMGQFMRDISAQSLQSYKAMDRLGTVPTTPFRTQEVEYSTPWWINVEPRVSDWPKPLDPLSPTE